MLQLLFVLPDQYFLAIIVSLILNSVIAIAGVIPSAFITAANIVYFGLVPGILVSIAGEALGAIISFYIYRKGTDKLAKTFTHKPGRLLTRLKKTKGTEAVLLVLALRVFPFVPSGLVTLTAAFSQMNGTLFAFASTVGKVPALLIEAYSIYAVMELSFKAQISLVAAALFLLGLYYLITRKKKL
ncbi:TVP38/TMEM64 family protein [Mesobacillus harenae]|uniref:TVP38/TMEM64 family protein n=1 Tax=Mesobacillus harenae TaxID=2213203 RepID=UPI0015801D56|nr:VTT domain-containing protein [Mesobacillus harenae]